MITGQLDIYGNAAPPPAPPDVTLTLATLIDVQAIRNLAATPEAADTIAARLFEWLPFLATAARAVTPIPSAPARPTDPHTSHAAAAANSTRDLRRFSTRSRTGRLLAAFDSAARSGRDGLTDQEAARTVEKARHHHLTVSQLEGTRRRCSDLRRLHLIADSGHTRQNVGSPEDSIVWAVTPLGKATAATLRETGWSL